MHQDLLEIAPEDSFAFDTGLPEPERSAPLVAEKEKKTLGTITFSRIMPSYELRTFADLPRKHANATDLCGRRV
jgi:hypothetical protein